MSLRLYLLPEEDEMGQKCDTRWICVWGWE